MLNIINSADGVLDVLLNIYKAVATKNIVEILCGWFGFKCCNKESNVSETEIKVERPVEKSIKVEVVENEIKVEEVKTDPEMPALESVEKSE
jgi:hypothetical protein